MKIVPFALFSLLLWNTGFSQKTDDVKTFNPHFEIFELPGGILGNTVQSIVQDHVGFLWFGSQAGLHRYDGQNFITYKPDPDDPNSLASDHINCIFIDSKGLIWLTYDGEAGLTAFEPGTETFKHYRHDPENPESLRSNTLRGIVEDRDGYMWVYGFWGLDRFDRKTGVFRHFRNDPGDPHSLSHDKVMKLYVDKQGTLWVGTGLFSSNDPDDKKQNFGGLNRYHPETESFTRYLHDPNDPNSLISNKVNEMLEDSKGNFWVGTARGGLHLMNREKGTFTRITNNTLSGRNTGKNLKRPYTPESIGPFLSLGIAIPFIAEDKDGRIWISGYSMGLDVYDPDAGAVHHYGVEKGDGKLPANELATICQSGDGVIWMSSSGFKNSVVKVTLQDDLFPFFKIEPFPGMGQWVSGIAKDKVGNIWIGYSEGAPLVRYDRKSGKAYPVPCQNASPGRFHAKNVSMLSLDRDGFLWISTNNGLFRHDPQMGTFQLFKPDKENPDREYGWFESMLQDRNGYIWIPEWDVGLHRLDVKTGKFTTFRYDPNDRGSLGGFSVGGLYEDTRGDLWIGGGVTWYSPKMPFFLDRFNQKTNTFDHIIKEGIGFACSFTGDNNGNIWMLDLVNGMQKFNPDNGKLEKFTIAGNYMTSEIPQSMAKANDGKFWIHSERSIHEFDPETGLLSSFTEKNGVRTGFMGEDSEIHVAYDGEILMAGDQGFVAFYPEKISAKKKSRPARVYITNFFLSDERVTPNAGAVLEKSIWQTSGIRLAHNQNKFSFSVACFDFHDPATNQLQFILEGFDEGWRKDLKDGVTPPYINIPPGEYVFRARGANSFGAWDEQGISLRITILPPWWKTWWAFTFYGFCLVAGIFLADRFQRKRLLEKERTKARERELAQAKEIEKAYAELKSTQAQLIQSEKLASLGELTAGIAHEIQNPLNFVNNFSELSVGLAEELQTEMDKLEVPAKDRTYVAEILNDLTQNQQKINHHGKRAAAIVTGMLQHARSSTGQKEPTDLNALADEYLRLAYHGLRAKDATFNAKIVTDLDPNVGLVNVVPQDIGRVFLNIINNAFYATQQRKSQLLEEEYDPTVSVTSRLLIPPLGGPRGAGGPGAGWAEFRIKDNGTGIPEDVRAKIFQPFFTTKPTGEGTGLGLSLAYDIVVKGHGGTLEVETMEGEGTEFILFLPTQPISA